MFDEAGSIRDVDRYIAVVPHDRPWSRPLDERVVTAGERMPRFEVETGVYGVVCIAAEHGVRMVPPRAMQDDVVVDCRFDTPVRGIGNVLDARTGAPIGGASISIGGLFAPESTTSVLSPLGSELASRVQATVSDADGRFEMLGKSGHGMLVWVEAPGYEPAWIPDVTVDASGEIGTVYLEPGGALVVDLELPETFPTERYHVEIRTDGPRWASTSLAERFHGARDGHAARIWQRHLPEPGVRRLVWPALPAGAYEVWLRGDERGAHQDLPIVLGQATVATQETTELVAASIAVPDEEPGDATAPPLRGVLTAPADLSTLEAVLWHRDRDAPVTVTTERVVAGRMMTVDTGCRSDAVAVLGGAEWIATPMMATGDCEVSSQLDVYEVATVGGRFVAPRGTQLDYDRAPTAHCEHTLESQQVATVGPFPFTLDGRGVWGVRVPTVCERIVLRAAGFAPVAVDTIGLDAGETVDLGTLELTHGASLLARVLDGRDDIPIAGVVVDLLTGEQVATLLANGLRHDEVEAGRTAITNEHGWVRLDGLSEGVFSVRARTDSHPLAAFSSPFELASGHELVLDDLVLDEPTRIEVVLEDDRGTVGPGDPVRLQGFSELASCGLRPTLAFETEVGADGVIVLPAVHPGSWMLSLALPGEQGRFNTVGSVSFEAFPGVTQQVSMPLDAQFFRGVVTYLDEPLARAELGFRADQPQPGFAAPRAVTDEDGYFELPIGARGGYTVMVADAEETLIVEVPDVRFDDPEQEVEIVLPAGRITGWVETADGAPVTSGFVHARRQERTDTDGQRQAGLRSGVRIGADGAFTFDAMAAGAWTLGASSDGRGSAPRLIEVAADQERGGVRLVIADREVIRGQIFADGAPVATASGRLLPLHMDDAVSRYELSFRTDADGRFEIDAPPGYRGRVNVVVEAPGWPLAAHVVDAEREVVLDLASYGGRLEIGLADPLVTPTRTMLLIHEDGGAVPLGSVELITWDGHVAIPNLAPGRWHLFHAPAATDALRLIRLGGLGQPLQSFDVVPGAIIEVDLDDRS
ncbi:MAG: carboxypeptidase-like regulatory domain-containing protein [Acidobacteriota bacterium]